MRKSAFAWLGCASTLLSGMLGLSASANAGFQPPPSSSSSHSNTGYVLTLRALGKIATATGTPTDGSGGPRYYYDFAPACQGNGAGGDAMCAAALARCKQQDPTALMYFVFRGIDPVALANVGQVCLGNPDFVDRQQLARDVVDELIRRLPLAAPVIASAPGRVSLVGLPTVVWAADAQTGAPGPATYRVSGTVDDVSVTLTVTGKWVWNLSDGTGPHTLTTAGTAYDPGTTPDPRVDPTYYTAHDGQPGTGLVAVYRRPGTYPLTVTVTWEPSYAVDYEVGTTDLDQDAVTYTADRALRVGEARAVLVSGG